MGMIEKIRQRIRQKGLRRLLRTAWERYVFFHWHLLWMERDLLAPVPVTRLRAHPPTQRVDITVDNADACARHFADQVDTLRELARDGHTGHMYLNAEGDAVAIIWGSTRDYHDRHYYGCTFKVAPDEYFQFCGELARPYLGTRLSIDAQVNLWAAKHALGCTRVVNVVAAHNLPALSLHVRMGYSEQGRVQHVYCLFGRWKFFRESHYRGSRLTHLRKARTPVAQAATT